ncbi:MAG: AbrB family transcriptional regulator [Solirubrobacteraceae bacterium]|nr:AbrB family transcriptional regulator [Solirubrobacteraceae bacterium]
MTARRRTLEVRRPSATTASRCLAVALATTAAGFAGAAVGVPSPALLMGLVVGLAFALSTRWELVLPARLGLFGQGVLGVSLGLFVQTSTLAEIGHNAVPILAVTALTLGATVVAGLLMTRLTSIDRATATFGMIAGGATGIVAISRELGADDRLVAVMQYLRVLTIMLVAPLVAGLAGGGRDVAGAGAEVVSGSWPAGLLALVVCMAVGMVGGRLVRLPAPALLGPLIVAAALTIADFDLMAPVPPAVLQVGYALIGLTVGLRFTLESLRHAAKIVPATMAMIVLLIVLSAGLGLLLVPLIGVGALDAYLATTPGGLYVVLASASSSDVDATFVLAVQVLRVFAMLGAAPLLARWLLRRDRQAATAAS